MGPLFDQLWILWETIDNAKISTFWNTHKKLMLGSCNFITLKLFHQKTACPLPPRVFRATGGPAFHVILPNIQPKPKKCHRNLSWNALRKSSPKPSRPNKWLSKFEFQLKHFKWSTFGPWLMNFCLCSYLLPKIWLELTNIGYIFRKSASKNGVIKKC